MVDELDGYLNMIRQIGNDDMIEARLQFLQLLDNHGLVDPLPADFRRDCRKSPQADSWVRCRKK